MNTANTFLGCLCLLLVPTQCRRLMAYYDPLNFADAEEACECEGGVLAHLQEADYPVLAEIKCSANMFIGFHQRGYEDGNWEWLDDDSSLAVDDPRWSYGQPNKGIRKNDYNFVFYCGGIGWDNYTDVNFFAKDCNQKLPYLCQFDDGELSDSALVNADGVQQAACQYQSEWCEFCHSVYCGICVFNPELSWCGGQDGLLCQEWDDDGGGCKMCPLPGTANLPGPVAKTAEEQTVDAFCDFCVEGVCSECVKCYGVPKSEGQCAECYEKIINEFETEASFQCLYDDGSGCGACYDNRHEDSISQSYLMKLIREDETLAGSSNITEDPRIEECLMGCDAWSTMFSQCSMDALLKPVENSTMPAVLDEWLLTCDNLCRIQPDYPFNLVMYTYHPAMPISLGMPQRELYFPRASVRSYRQCFEAEAIAGNCNPWAIYTKCEGGGMYAVNFVACVLSFVVALSVSIHVARDQFWLKKPSQFFSERIAIISFCDAMYCVTCAPTVIFYFQAMGSTDVYWPYEYSFSLAAGYFALASLIWSCSTAGFLVILFAQSSSQFTSSSKFKYLSHVLTWAFAAVVPIWIRALYVDPPETIGWFTWQMLLVIIWTVLALICIFLYSVIIKTMYETYLFKSSNATSKAGSRKSLDSIKRFVLYPLVICLTTFPWVISMLLPPQHTALFGTWVIFNLQGFCNGSLYWVKLLLGRKKKKAHTTVGNGSSKGSSAGSSAGTIAGSVGGSVGGGSARASRRRKKKNGTSTGTSTGSSAGSSAGSSVGGSSVGGSVKVKVKGKK